MSIKVTVTTNRSGPPLGDAITFPIRCPECNHETEQSVSRLKDAPILVCPACSYHFKVESGGTGRQVADQIQEIDRLIDGFGKP